jgi:hypothetical protein
MIMTFTLINFAVILVQVVVSWVLFYNQTTFAHGVLAAASLCILVLQLCRHNVEHDEDWLEFKEQTEGGDYH